MKCRIRNGTRYSKLFGAGNWEVQNTANSRKPSIALNHNAPYHTRRATSLPEASFHERDEKKPLAMWFDWI